MHRLIRRALPAGLIVALCALAFTAAAPARAEAAQRPVISCGQSQWAYVPNRFMPTHFAGGHWRGCGVLKWQFGKVTMHNVGAAYQTGKWWCLAVSQTPAGPYGVAMSWWKAANYCKDRGWQFISYY